VINTDTNVINYHDDDTDIDKYDYEGDESMKNVPFGEYVLKKVFGEAFGNIWISCIRRSDQIHLLRLGG
jgi:hypothetical protein